MVYYPAKCVYFLTGSTFLHYPYFKEPEDKEILLNQISKIKEKLGVKICAYSIQINHYHLMFYTKSDKDVEKIKQYMHGGTSFIFKKRRKLKYKEMWGSQKTLQVWSEETYWKILGYICGNLLKHKEVSIFDELSISPFSSYSYMIDKYGKDFVQQMIYNIIDVDEDASGELDFKELKNSKVKIPAYGVTPAKAG